MGGFGRHKTDGPSSSGPEMGQDLAVALPCNIGYPGPAVRGHAIPLRFDEACRVA